MFNIIKYEIRNIYKMTMGLIIVFLVINLALLTKVNIWSENALIGVNALIAFSIGVGVFISNINLLNRDMYSDTGYLMFTLPQSGYSIIGAKVIVSFLQSLFIGVISFVLPYAEFKGLRDGFSCIYSNINTASLIKVMVGVIFSYIFLIVLVYFCITISRVAFNGRKIGKVGSFVVFIVISIGLGKITELIDKAIPNSAIHLSQGNMTFNSSFSVVSIAFNMIVCIILFLGSAYLIDKKLDL